MASRPLGRILVAHAKKDAWVSALKRGRAERIQVWQTAQGWRARAYRYSGKQPKGGGPYTLLVAKVHGGVSIICMCQGWGYNGYCKHAAVLASRLGRRGQIVRLDVVLEPPARVESQAAALARSTAASKDYNDQLFGPVERRTPDTHAAGLRMLSGGR